MMEFRTHSLDNITTHYAIDPDFHASSIKSKWYPELDSIVGFIRVIPYSDSKNAIDKVWVDPAYRRSGVATSLLRRAEGASTLPLYTPVLTNDGSKFFAKTPLRENAAVEALVESLLESHMPYELKKVKGGWQVTSPGHPQGFKKKPHKNKEDAIDQMAAIKMSAKESVSLIKSMLQEAP
jgi:GNAT superfamily N-acetyltransferase